MSEADHADGYGRLRTLLRQALEEADRCHAYLAAAYVSHALAITERELEVDDGE